MKRILVVTSALAFIAGIVMICGGTWGIMFTYKNVVQEKITTSKDASIPETRVVGPLTLKAQADVIREHTLKSTGGLVYAEMPGQIPKLDANGKQEVNAEGKPVTVSNPARTIWVTATTLTTALNLGIITYAFSGLIFFLGLISLWTGMAFFALSRKA